MRRHLALLCLFLALLACPLTALPEPPREDAARLDRYGDPLPDGVMARLGTVRFRGAGLDAVAYSPDGSLLATANILQVSVWDARTGRNLAQYSLEDAPTRRIPTWISFLAFSPDGRQLAVGFDRHPLRIWTLATGAEVQVDPEIRAWAFGGGFTADGKHLVAVGDKQVRVIERATHQVVRSWDIPFMGKEPIQGWEQGSSALAPDGKTLALVAQQGQQSCMSLWDISTGEELYRLDVPAGFVIFSGDGKTLLGMGGGMIHLFDAATGSCAGRQCLAHGFSRIPVALSRDGKILAVSSALYDLATGEELRRIDWAEERYPGTVAFSPDGRQVAIVAGGTIEVQDLFSGQPALLGDVPRIAPDRVHLLPDGRTLATASLFEGSVRLWNPRTGEQLHKFELPDLGPVERRRDQPSEVAFSDCAFAGNKFAYPGRDRVHILDLKSGKIDRTVSIPIPRVFRDLLLSDDGTTLLVRDWPGKVPGVRILDTATGRVRCQLGNPGEQVFALALSPDGRVACISPLKGDVRLHDTTTGELLFSLNHRVLGGGSPVNFSPDGRILATALPEPPALFLWDVATGRLLRHVAGTETCQGRCAILRIVFSPDGRSLATWGPVTRTDIWETATLQVRCSLHELRPLMAFAGQGLLASNPWVLHYTMAKSDVRIHDLALAVDTRLPADPWAALIADAGPAYRAIRALIARPEQATALLREKLRAVPVVDSRRIRQLIADLDADNYDTREQASRELALLGEQAEGELTEARKSPRSAEQARRLTVLLPGRDGPLHPERLRFLRALEVLEEIATPDARAILERLARGEPTAEETRQARAAQERLRGAP
jgi:WD40 repeat protein